jgi:hypothetical protein
MQLAEDVGLLCPLMDGAPNRDHPDLVISHWQRWLNSSDGIG